MNLNDLLRQGRERLRRAAVDSYMLDAEVLLRHASGLSRVALLTAAEKEIDGPTALLYHQYLSLRENHMPVAYITNSVEFMSLPFYVDDRVLIPRPDTEGLVERALAMIHTQGFTSVLELCTGSGCIAAALAHYAERVRVTATDISVDALAVARENARRLGVEARITFLEGDLFEALPASSPKFDLLVANPPYIRSADIAGLGRNVREYEPQTALDGGADGLGFYRRLCAGAAAVLNPDGVILFEIGYDQGPAVVALLTEAGYATETVQDWAGHDRVVVGIGR